jgi:phosphate transport system substrate-binding protein
MRKTLLWVLMTSLGTALPGLGQATEQIRINGSGTALDMLKPLAEAYQRKHPQVRIAIEKPLGSSGAIKALLAGALDLALSSKPLSSEEAGRGARLQSYGRTPLAIVVEKNVPISDLTTQQLEDLYAGRLSQWKSGSPIRLVLRPQGDIDTQILRLLSPGMNQAVSLAHGRPGMLMAVTDPEATALIVRTQGGIGASGLAGLLVEKTPLKVLTLNGVRPTTGTLASGAYPLGKEISVVTTAKTSAAARAFIDFIYSAAGRSQAEKVGVLVTGSWVPSR